MITLYHFPRAICAQKVRVALAEKGLSFESRITSPAVLRSPDYLALNPNGYVPTFVHGDAVLIESRIINEYIEDAFPAPALKPSGALARARIGAWTKQIDDSLHLNVFILTFVGSFRKGFLALPDEVRERGLPLNLVKRSITLDLAAKGADSGYYIEAVRRFRTLLDQMDASLSQSEWLVGGSYSLADVDFTPYLRRLDELGLWALVGNRYPHVARWFDAVRARPSFQTAIGDWETDEGRQREAAESAEARPALEAALAA